MSKTTVSSSTDSWESRHYACFTLYDIDHEFQMAHESYEQWLAKTRQKRSGWACLSRKGQDDALGKVLRLGGAVQKLLEMGRTEFGSRFEQGDSLCHTVLSAQLLRLQHEIKTPLLDSAHASRPSPIPYDGLITAAKSIRRTCLNALRDQYARLQTPKIAPVLPPPRFSVKFCPFALGLRNSPKGKFNTNDFQTKKVRPHHRHDEREMCPYCDAHISVTPHSGLPQYRRILFESHVANSTDTPNDTATFACTSCYKTFNDSYAFLDHVFLKEIGSEQSCLRRWSGRWNINENVLESNPMLVEKCLRNCLKRELTRARAMKKTQALEAPAARRESKELTIFDKQLAQTGRNPAVFFHGLMSNYSS